MKKLVFGITNLEIGGAERVLVDIANRLKDQYEITIFTIYGDGKLAKELDKKVKLISLTKKKYSNLSFLSKKIYGIIFSSNILIKLIYKKYIANKFDVEISFLEGPITRLFSNKSNRKKIAWVHTNLAKHNIKNKQKIKEEKAYKKYNSIVFVSQDAFDGFNDIFNVDVDKKIIHNYMNTQYIVDKSSEFVPDDMEKDGDYPIFISVCRLVKAKAIDRLVLVSKKLIENGYNHKIYIIGDGPERKVIEKLIDKMEIKNNFVLLGEKNNPFPYMKKADYFILPSSYEGYGMVLVEAMCLGKTIIATNTGAKEALAEYEDKLIVDNSIDGIYEGMKKIINKEIIVKNKRKANYDTEKIMSQIIFLLDGDL